MSTFLIFCLLNYFVQYAVAQRVNGPTMVNNGLQYGPNTGQGSLMPGQQLGRISPELGVTGGPGMGQIGPNQSMGSYGQIRQNNQAYPNAGMPNQAIGSTGMPNQAFGGPGMPNKRIVGGNMPNQFNTNPGTPTSRYGGAGNGDVTVNGELPVNGMTSVKGHVPLTGKVAFNGNVPCGGTVIISGSCTSGGLGAPVAKLPAYRNIANKPLGIN